MYGQPSRSASKTITPPLMDSTMYFFAGSEVCLKVIPVFAVMSSSWGIGRLLHLVDLAPGGGGEGVGWPPWANAKFAERPRSNKDFARCFKSGAIKRVPGKGYHGRSNG